MLGRLNSIAFACFLSAVVLAPVDGAQAAVSIPFTITLSEVVTVTGTPRITVDVGGVTRYALYSAGSGTNTLTFTLSPQAGDVDLDGVALSSPIDLNGGAIIDAAGNNATLNFTPPNTSGIKIDYPSLGMDFVYDADGRYTLSGVVYNDLTSFLTAAGGTYSRSSTGTYYDSTGTLQTAASGVPRFDYDPLTHAPKGILLEESRTNLAKNSENMSVWNNNTALTITSDAMIAPNGTLTADTTSSIGSTRYTTASVTSGTQYTYSFFVKPTDPANYIQIYVDGTAGTGYCRIAPSTGVVVGTSGTYNSAGVVNVGNGWYRVFMVFTPTTTGYQAVHIYPISANLTGWWGAQLEAGSFPTSYIPTSAATVTRSADLLSFTTGAWYDQSQGSVFSELSWLSSSGAQYPLFWRFRDGASTNKWSGFFRQSNLTLGVDSYLAGAAQGPFSSSATGASGSAKIAGAQALNDANATFSGTLGTTDTSWTPPAFTTLVFSIANGTEWLKQFKYYPYRVLNAQLQFLTQ